MESALIIALIIIATAALTFFSSMYYFKVWLFKELLTEAAKKTALEEYNKAMKELKSSK